MTTTMSDRQLQTRIIETPAHFEANFVPALRRFLAAHSKEKYRLLQIGFHNVSFRGTSFRDLTDFYNKFGPDYSEAAQRSLNDYFATLSPGEGTAQIAIRARMTNKHNITDSYFALASEAQFDAAPDLAVRIVSALDERELMPANPSLRVSTHVGALALGDGEKQLKGISVVLNLLAQDAAKKTPSIAYYAWAPPTRPL